MIRDWFRSRKQLVDELTQARGLLAAGVEATRLQFVEKLEEAREQAVDADRLRKKAEKDRDFYLARLRAEQSNHTTTQRKLDVLAAEIEGRPYTFEPAPPRTPSQELALERARADALAARVQQLQEANMRAGCMHGIPVQKRVPGR